MNNGCTLLEKHNEVREEVRKDHIKQHNGNANNNYYTEPERLEDLLNTEHDDVVQETLKEFKEKHVETNRKILDSTDSRPRLFERYQISGDIIGGCTDY